MREAADVRVVSFNIHHGTVGRRGPVDPEQLGEVCAGFDADVIALQEVDQGTWRAKGADLAAVAGRIAGMDHVFGRSRWFPGGAYGNAVLVQGEIAASHVHRLPRSHWYRLLQERRTVLEVEAVVAGRTVSVACTHLGVRPEINTGQFQDLLHRSVARPAPVVVLGDLNRNVALVEPQTVAAGLRFVHHDPTFPAHRPRSVIDHVLVSPGVTVVATEVRSTPISDHAALLVDLDLGPEA